MAITQASYRFRNDDGSESAATWMAALNTAVAFADTNTTFRIRIRVQSDGVASPDFKLQYNHNGGGWTDVTNSSSVIQSTVSSHFFNGESTTQQIGAGTFVDGEMDEDDGGGGDWGAVDFSGSDETELEGVYVMLAADVAGGDSISLRLVEQDDTEFDNYSEVPVITVGEGDSSPPDAMFLKKRRTQMVLQNL